VHIALLGDRSLRCKLAGQAQRRLVHESAGGRQGGRGVELQGWIPASSQMLADEQGYEEQRQDAERAKAAKVTKPGDAGMGELGHVSSSCLVKDGGRPALYPMGRALPGL
jgi:hypothetical protein